MEALRQYILSVISIVVLSGIVTLFSHGSSHDAIIKLVTGLMVTVTVLSPLLKNPKLSFDGYLGEISIDADHSVRYGKRMASEAEAAYIIDAMESYICSNAKKLGMEIAAEIMLPDSTVKAPDKVIISGKFSPYSKKRLGELIHSDLGISEERQIWISRNWKSAYRTGQ